MSRQYLNASKAVEEVIVNQRSFKQYCHSISIGKTEYALACETLKYASLLDELFRRCEISAESLQVRRGLLLVMTYELLFGKKKIQGGGAVKRAVTNVAEALKSKLDELIEENSNNQTIFPNLVFNKRSNENEIMFTSSVKYARINEIKCTITKGFNQLKLLYPNVEVDTIIPSLLVFTDLTKGLADLDMVKKGELILQDKASCFPSQVLGDAITSYYDTRPSSHSPRQGNQGDAIDCCAAPGNKTGHIAAILHNLFIAGHLAKPSTLYAFERDARRHDLLKSRMVSAGADAIVRPVHTDFLSVNPCEECYRNIRFALADPSCSGSGLQSLDRIAEGDYRNLQQNKERLIKLQTFQLSILKHALQFPSLEYLVYSTCSIHTEENEEVVAALLRESPDWTLAAPPRLSGWARRGVTCDGLTKEQSKCLIRCLPEDNTSGFFVALFQKKNITTTQETDTRTAPSSTNTCRSRYIYCNQAIADGGAKPKSENQVELCIGKLKRYYEAVSHGVELAADTVVNDYRFNKQNHKRLSREVWRPYQWQY